MKPQEVKGAAPGSGSVPDLPPPPKRTVVPSLWREDYLMPPRPPVDPEQIRAQAMRLMATDAAFADKVHLAREVLDAVGIHDGGIVMEVIAVTLVVAEKVPVGPSTYQQPHPQPCTRCGHPRSEHVFDTFCP